MSVQEITRDRPVAKKPQVAIMNAVHDLPVLVARGAQARACEVLAKDPRPYVKYLVAETGGLLQESEFQAWRLLNAPPQPYTRERWDDTYRWTVGWNMTVPGATYENTVDNRAWEQSRG